MNTTMNLLFLTKPLTTSLTQFPIVYKHRPLQPPILSFIKSSSSGSSSSSGNNNTSNDAVNASPPSPPANTVEIRFRRGSRRRKQLQQQDSASDGLKKVSPPKEWESMTLAEKAMELYVGEKGLLFWLNKLAYASIFIVIGGWILFRFVGPSLNLYQLDTPPLSPSSILKTP